MSTENMEPAGPSEEQIEEARSLGWAPKDAWKGDPEKWVDADQFLQRGLGIHHVRKELESLRNTTSARVSQLESALAAANTTIEVLQESHADDVKAQVEEARAALRQEIAQASRDGDHEALATATDKLTQLNAANTDAGGDDDKGGKGDKPNKDAPAVHPEVKAWFDDNPDYADRRRAALLHTVATELRQAGDARKGREFLDACAEEVEKYLGTPAGKRGTSKVEGGGNGTGGRGSSGSGKSYADLPAEAKAACDSFAKRVVGPNRAHKDLNSWRTAYATKYFAGQGN